MRIVEIAALDNMAHRNQTISGTVTPPDGWAVIPDSMTTENFPFGSLEAENIDGVMTVTSWTPGAIPEPEPEPEPEPTAEDRISALEAENRLLQAQVEMQAQQKTFLEDCLLEMGDVVYA